jgi:hypothetical protein
MLSATELERRVVRGREIVARQRELAAKLGEDCPLAIKVLNQFERFLALLEDRQRKEVLTNTVEKAVRGSGALLVASFPICPSPADITGPEPPDHQGRMRRVALVMEILRDAGYQSELAKETFALTTGALEAMYR